MPHERRSQRNSSTWSQIWFQSFTLNLLSDLLLTSDLLIFRFFLKFQSGCGPFFSHSKIYEGYRCITIWASVQEYPHQSMSGKVSALAATKSCDQYRRFLPWFSAAFPAAVIDQAKPRKICCTSCCAVGFSIACLSSCKWCRRQSECKSQQISLIRSDQRISRYQFQIMKRHIRHPLIFRKGFLSVWKISTLPGRLVLRSRKEQLSPCEAYWYVSLWATFKHRLQIPKYKQVMFPILWSDDVLFGVLTSHDERIQFYCSSSCLWILSLWRGTSERYANRGKR